MKFFVTYTPDLANSGEIKRAGVCQDSTLPLQAASGDIAIGTDFLFTPATHKIVAGAVVAKTTDEIQAYQTNRKPS